MKSNHFTKSTVVLYTILHTFNCHASQTTFEEFEKTRAQLINLERNILTQEKELKKQTVQFTQTKEQLKSTQELKNNLYEHFYAVKHYWFSPNQKGKPLKSKQSRFSKMTRDLSQKYTKEFNDCETRLSPFLSMSPISPTYKKDIRRLKLDLIDFLLAKIKITKALYKTQRHIHKATQKTVDQSEKAIIQLVHKKSDLVPIYQALESMIQSTSLFSVKNPFPPGDSDKKFDSPPSNDPKK